MPLSWKQIQLNAAAFSERWKGAYYEKGEAQTFYNELFGVFGVDRKIRAVFEKHVPVINARTGSRASGFIDVFWPGVFIAEHKSLGEDLVAAEQQVDEYCRALTEAERPRYQLTCDFQHFCLIDLENDAARTTFTLDQLPAYVYSLGFLVGKETLRARPLASLNQEAAEHISRIYTSLLEARYPEASLEQFITRLVFCLFANHTGIFQPLGTFTDFIESRTKVDGSDLGAQLAHLYQVLSDPPERRQRDLDSELAQYPFINGGLFDASLPIATLTAAAREHLLSAAYFNWAQVSPAIFGALFQSVLSREERRAIGAFATAEANICKVIDDLFLRDLRHRLDELRAKGHRGIEGLKQFCLRLRDLRVFDPACGCGNFLVVAYREIRAVELDALDALNSLGALNAHEKIAAVDVDQLYGLERRGYSAMIARTAIWMTDHIANNALSIRLGVHFERVPLVKSPHIVVGDALVLDWDTIVGRSRDLCIVGNPPYRGSKVKGGTPQERALFRHERARVRALAAEAGVDCGTLDLVCGWLFKAAALAGDQAVVGLVTVNSVVQGQQVAPVWTALSGHYGMELVFAHQSFKWESDTPADSQVQVVVLGLEHRARARTQRVVYSYSSPTARPTPHPCRTISPYLVVGDGLVDPNCFVTPAGASVAGLPTMRTGAKPIDGGYYVLTQREERDFVAAERSSARYVRPYVGAKEFLTGRQRFIIEPSGITARDLRSRPRLKSIVGSVKRWRNGLLPEKNGTALRSPSATPDRKELEMRSDPTMFHWHVLLARRALIVPLVTSENRRYVPLGWIDPPAVPSNLVAYIEDATQEVFALMQSAMHMTWLRSIGGRLEGRLRYSINVVYNTFPVPVHDKGEELVLAANAIVDVRERLANAGLSLDDMYSSLVMPAELERAHSALDKLVDRIYLGSEAHSDEERLPVLLRMYEELVRLRTR